MKHPFNRIILAMFMIAVLLTTACESLNLGLGREEEPPPPPTGQYLDFNDIQIPSDFKLDRESSFVYESNQVKAGVLGLTGKMPLVDALKYFEGHMTRDGWAMLSSFKYHKNILIYTKPEKVALIIASHPYGNETLRLEVWVSPTQPGWTAGMDYSQPDVGRSNFPLVNTPGPREEDLGDPNESS